MDHPNNNTHLYHDPFATGCRGSQERVGVSPMTKPSYTQIPGYSAAGWEMNPGIGQWSDLYASTLPTSANYESVAPALSHISQGDDFNQPPDTDPYWPMILAQSQLNPANFPSCYSSLAGALTLDVPATALASSNSSPSLHDFSNPSPQPEPSGGSASEISADAEQLDPDEEQDEVSHHTEECAKCQTQEWTRPYRLAELQRRLIAWAEMRSNGKERANFTAALSTAVEAIKPIRPVAFLHYISNSGPQPKTQSGIAERELFGDLSLRYPPGGKRWTRPDLLERLVVDLETCFPHPAS